MVPDHSGSGVHGTIVQLYNGTGTHWYQITGVQVCMVQLYSYTAVHVQEQRGTGVLECRCSRVKGQGLFSDK